MELRVTFKEIAPREEEREAIMVVVEEVVVVSEVEEADTEGSLESATTVVNSDTDVTSAPLVEREPPLLLASEDFALTARSMVTRLVTAPPRECATTATRLVTCHLDAPTMPFATTARELDIALLTVLLTLSAELVARSATLLPHAPGNIMKESHHVTVLTSLSLSLLALELLLLLVLLEDASTASSMVTRPASVPLSACATTATALDMLLGSAPMR